MCSAHTATRSPAAQPELPIEGYLGDMTGPGITNHWGVTCADLGVSGLAPNGKLVSIFGDTFSGAGVGQGQWRSPVALIGAGDANNRITYQHAGGADRRYAQQCGLTFTTVHPGTGAASALSSPPTSWLSGR